jgi:hypothetical protein
MIRPKLPSIASLICLLIACLSSPIASQPELDRYEDAVYRDYIRSVRMHVNGLSLTLPIASINSFNSLFLSFDELDGEGTRYYYTVIHCDRHWNPTEELSQFEYLGGFREGEIDEYEFSTGTYQDYVHYKLTLPNEDVRWTITGNYILAVYEQGEENDPILTRRFMIVDEKLKVQAEVVRPAVVAKQNTHQEIDFLLDIGAIRSNNPRMEIFPTILQNGRWDNSIQDIEARLITGTELNYNFTDQIVFEAGKEFRNMDISSMEYRSENVLDIEEYEDGFSTILYVDHPRYNQAYLWRRDLNGKYVPFNRDFYRKSIPLDSLTSTLNLVNRFNYREQFLNSEYSDVLVTLEIPQRDREIYLVGGMTDWQMLPEYRMTYDERVGGYVGQLFLKQGYYNYGYAMADQLGHPEFTTLEGNWYATENDYTLLVYFRPRGGQYDQLIAAHTFNSNY